MNAKKHLWNPLLYVGSTLLLASNYNYCNKSDAIKKREESNFYTENRYTLPTYTPEEFAKMFSMSSSKEITAFRKELNQKLPKWKAGGREKEPYTLWENFNKEFFPNPEDLPKHLSNYHNSWANLLKNPTQENEAQLISSIQQLNADATAKAYLQNQVEIYYNDPMRLKLTKAFLEYQEFLDFIVGENTKMRRWNDQEHHLLQKWKEAGHKSGLSLWEAILEQHGKELREKFVLLTEPKNQQAIKNSLQILDDLTERPYGLTYKELEETVPHGLELLDIVLSHEELLKGDNKNRALLKEYCAFFSA